MAGGDDAATVPGAAD